MLCSSAGEIPTIPTNHSISSRLMAFTFLMPWQQSFQGSNADDVVYTFSNNQTIDVEEGDNFVLSLGNNTEANSGHGDDTFIMLGANQEVRSSGGDNVVMTGFGDDWVVLSDGDDWVTSFGGNNTINTAGGDDYIKVGNGNDWLFSGDGDDIIHGGGGSNFMNAGDGDDLLVATGTVRDTLTGGAGGDTFDISQAEGDVRINDFSFAEGDVLRIDAGVIGHAFIGGLQQGNDAVVDYSGGTITVKDFFAQGNINMAQIELV